MAGVQDADPPSPELLARLAAGDVDAAGEMHARLYDALHGLARKLMARERDGHTLQTTALLHEAWMRVAGSEVAVVDDAHFVRLAARAMRRVLVDHARKRGALKRQHQRARPLEEDALATWAERPEDLLDLDAALEALGEEDEDLLRLVELRYFAGLTLEECARMLGSSLTSTHRSWTFARGWLKRRLAVGGTP